jgi:hypothetical protein
MNFDLNIDNYTREELVDLFDLPPAFDANMFELKESRLRNSILNNQQISEETQMKTIQFILQAKNIILNANSNSGSGSGNPFNKKIEKILNANLQLQPSQIADKEEHMVQIRPKSPYLSSFPNEYNEGVVNPLIKKTILKHLNIDTRFRENYYGTSSTNFNVILPIKFNNILKMELSAIELPTSYHIVSKQFGNHFFSITVDGLSAMIEIPNGNYTQDTIMEAINNQLSLLGAPYNTVNFVANSSTLNDTGSYQTMVGFTGENENNIDHTMNLELNFQTDVNGVDDHGTPLPLKLGWILGFRNGIYENSLKYVSEGVVDVTGSRYLYLVVDDHNNSVNNGFYSAFNSSMLNNNILARISLNNTGSFSVLAENNFNIVTTAREYFGPVNIQQFGIQLLDEYGRVVDLNNMDFSFCLTLTTVYDI